MKKLHIIIVSAALLALGSCKKSLDINHNPNNATNASPELVLPNALKVTADQPVIGFTFLQEWMGYWAPSGSYAAGPGDVASYLETNTGTGTGFFGTAYHNLEDYDYVEKQGVAQNKPFYEAAAKIMKAYVFQMLVDTYGDVPYTQALQGTNIIQPKYDKAQDIYDSLINNLDAAVTLMQRPDATAASNSDIMFGGNTSNWIAFDNTLKLRMLVRLSNVTADAGMIQTEIGKITSNGFGFLTADAGVNPGYANNSGQQNPVYGFFVTLTGLPTSGGQADFFRAAQYAISTLKNLNDSRLNSIYAPGTSGMVGTIEGGTNNLGGGASATIGPGILKSVSQPSILISAAESYFLQAEAISRGWLGGNLITTFDNGVQASFTFLGAGDATSYYTQPDKMANIAICVTPGEKLACIIRQKWIAEDGVLPFEAWCDYRRLMLPADIPISVSSYKAPGAVIPQRIIYPESEYQDNATNVNTEGNIDPQTSKIFWAQ